MHVTVREDPCRGEGGEGESGRGDVHQIPPITEPITRVEGLVRGSQDRYVYPLGAGSGIGDGIGSPTDYSPKVIASRLWSCFTRVMACTGSGERADQLRSCLALSGVLRQKLERLYATVNPIMEATCRVDLLLKDLLSWDIAAKAKEDEFIESAHGRSVLVSEEMRQAALEAKLAANLAMEGTAADASRGEEEDGGGGEVVVGLVKRELDWLVEQLQYDAF